MVAELDAIPDPGERTRFAVGAVAAVLRLAIGGLLRTIGFVESRAVHFPGGPPMPTPSPRQLLRRHAKPFVLSLVALTGLLLANQAVQRVPQLAERGMPTGVIAEVLLLSIPFTLALTIPMAVFISVAWVFNQLGKEGVLSRATRERDGFRRLVAPVLGAAAVVAMMTLVLNTQVIPRTNTLLKTAIVGTQQAPSDREMTVGELREAARTVQGSAGVDAAARAAAYQVEIHKKFALAAAIVLLALAGAAIPTRFPRGGIGLVIGASVLVFAGYFFSLTLGESLADRQAVSPWIAMWMANGALLGAALILLLGSPRSGPAEKAEALGIDGTL
jgi:lipopolysaccharide export LptBFGC system permease protein LptF